VRWLQELAHASYGMGVEWRHTCGGTHVCWVSLDAQGDLRNGRVHVCYGGGSDNGMGDGRIGDIRCG